MPPVSFIIKRLTGINHVKKTFRMAVDQAAAFLECYRDRLEPEQIALLATFSGLLDHSKARRLLIVCREGFWKQGLVQRIGEIMFI